MTAARLAARTDANQREVVAALRAVGATVQHLHAVGRGCPDLCVGFRGVNYLIEIKDGSKPPSARRLTADEKIWHDSWQGTVCVVESVDDALNAIGTSARVRE